MENVVSDSEWEKEKYAQQTCQPLVKENQETHEKKSGDSAKNSEILFFPYQTPVDPLDTNLIPRAYSPFFFSPFKMADRHGERQWVIAHKQKSQLDKKCSKYSVFLLIISLSLYGTSIEIIETIPSEMYSVYMFIFMQVVAHFLMKFRVLHALRLVLTLRHKVGNGLLHEWRDTPFNYMWMKYVLSTGWLSYLV